MTWLSRLCRALAVAIAIAAAIDPAMRLLRADRRSVAVIDAGGAELTASVSQALSNEFDVHAGAVAGAAATLIVGNELPAPSAITSGALFAVVPAARSPRVEIERVAAPGIAPSGSRVAVLVSVRAVGLRGRSIVVDLFAGSLAVDSVTRALTQDDERVNVAVALPPSAAGLLGARVVARDAGSRALSVERHAIVDIRDQRWRVLVADPRPSWASTFVRRALEADRRFDIASRVGTSKALSVASGIAPPLLDSAALAEFDAIVIGAPSELTATEVRAIERFARERGGAVVLLLDRIELGALAPIIGVTSLADVHGAERMKVSAVAGNQIATELALPQVGAGITPLALASIGGKDTPVIWQSALGAGRVVVNGALDAWRYRTRESGGFSKFWVDAIAAAASASPASLVLTTETPRVAPGATFTVRAIVREAQLSDPSRPAPMVELNGPPLFWPAEERGVFLASVTAPDAPGNYAIKVRDGVLRYSVVPEVDPQPDPALLTAWTTSRGGTVLTDDLAGVMSRVRTAVNTQYERVETHPIRSPWWLPVFVILLGAEWWIRRRRGER